MLSIQNLSYSIAGRQILDDINISVDSRQHIGFVGRNGSGKSTLFNLILGHLEHDSGKIQIENNCKIMAVEQKMPSGKMTPREFILSQDIERNDLMQQLENCADNPEKMSEIYDHLIRINAFDAESRAAVILNGLGFGEEKQGMPIDSFSGGFRMRIALGAILYQEPDLLLLDEPTNHLDLETSNWLKNFLKSYSKSFILISHDRDFLNDTVNGILFLKNKKIKKYAGNFDTFLDTYTMQQKNAEAFNAKMEEKRAHMMAYVNKFGAKATKAKQAQSRLKAISKLKFIPVDSDDPTLSFDFPEPSTIASNILTFEKVSLGYNDHVVLKNVSGSIMSDDKIAVVGPNGNGKTTFAKFLAGELKQKKGIRTACNKLEIGFYRQDLFEKLDVDIDPYEYIQQLAPDMLSTKVRGHLGKFGFSGDQAFQKIGKLSGGERARLVFAALTLNAPHMLILDEPTNHLDIEMRESLICALTEYRGAVVLITHDRHFLNRVANSIFVVGNGTITQFYGDINQYENSRM